MVARAQILPDAVVVPVTASGELSIAQALLRLLDAISPPGSGRCDRTGRGHASTIRRMISQPFRRVAGLLVVGVIGLGLTGCSNNSSDAATITYHDSSGEQTIHITRSAFTQQVSDLVASKQFQTLLKAVPLDVPGDQKNTTGANMSAIYLSSLVEQSAWDAEFSSLNLKTTASDRTAAGAGRARAVRAEHRVRRARGVEGSRRRVRLVPQVAAERHDRPWAARGGRAPVLPATERGGGEVAVRPLLQADLSVGPHGFAHPGEGPRHGERDRDPIAERRGRSPSSPRRSRPTPPPRRPAGRSGVSRRARSSSRSRTPPTRPCSVS